MNNGNNTQKNYLSIEPLPNVLAAFFIKKTRLLSKTFSNSGFGMRVYRGKNKAGIEDISLYAFLGISPRQINALKKIKLDPREPNKVDDIDIKKNAAQFNEYLKSTTKKSKK